MNLAIPSARGGRLRPRLWVIGLALLVACLVAAAPAAARSAYVTNSGNGTVSVFNTATGAVSGVIVVGGKPVDVAIAPNGGRAYVVDEQRGTVIVIDTATNAAIASIPVGGEPRGIAIAPNGAAAAVTNFADGTLSIVNLATDATVGTIPVGAEPEGVALADDGLHAYVARRSGGIAIVDLPLARVVTVVPDGLGPSRIALGPNNGRAFVTNAAAGSVTVFDPATGQLVGGPIGVPSPPAGIAVAPSGRFAYAASPKAGAVSAIDTTLNAATGLIGPLPGAGGVAIEPSGRLGFATDSTGTTASVFDTASGRGLSSVATGPEPTGIAVVPDQGPTAGFWVSPGLRLAKRKLTFHAGPSTDPDGKIVTYAWDWGDGHHVKTTSGTKGHRYAAPGVYQATLAVTDDEGCTTEVVFTGQTASCNGSTRAAVTMPIEVLDPRAPGLDLAGGRRQRVRGAVNVFARCPVANCGLRARGTIVADFRRHGTRHRYRLHIGPRVVSATVGDWVRLPVQVPRGRRRAVLRALRYGGDAEARLTVLGRDAHGIQKVGRRTVDLVHGHRPGSG